MFARTERLLLRPAWMEDAPALARAIGDEGIVRNLSRAPWPYREEDAKSFCAREAEPLFPSFMIVRRTLGMARLIGGCGLNPVSAAIDEAELGYWLARPVWGQGFATEAAGAVVRIADAIGYRRLHASYAIDNPASGRVLRKLGFTVTGSKRQHSLGRGGEMECVTLERPRGAGSCPAGGDDGEDLMSDREVKMAA